MLNTAFIATAEVQIECSRVSEKVPDACVQASESESMSHLKDTESIFIHLTL